MGTGTMLGDILVLIAGLATLIISGEILVKGAVGVALKYGVSPLVIGMTIVSFGTSAPELLVSVKAALNNHPDLAIGNVLGSNVANLALVMGITALIFPIPVDKNTLRLDWPVMMVSVIVLWLFMLNNTIQSYEGLIMVTILLGFNIWLVRNSRKKSRKNNNEKLKTVKEEIKPRIILRNFMLIIVGCAGLMFGADWLVQGAVGIAEFCGMDEFVIGVTVVAFGTSAPELATSCIAAYRKQTDISVGNLIGSNIFNVFGILGVTSVITPISVSDRVIGVDMIWVVVISALLFPLMAVKRKVGVFGGVCLILYYFSYIVFSLV